MQGNGFDGRDELDVAFLTSDQSSIVFPQIEAAWPALHLSNALWARAAYYLYTHQKSLAAFNILCSNRPIFSSQTAQRTQYLSLFNHTLVCVETMLSNQAGPLPLSRCVLSFHDVDASSCLLSPNTRREQQKAMDRTRGAPVGVREHLGE